MPAISLLQSDDLVVCHFTGLLAHVLHLVILVDYAETLAGLGLESWPCACHEELLLELNVFVQHLLIQVSLFAELIRQQLNLLAQLHYLLAFLPQDLTEVLQLAFVGI